MRLIPKKKLSNLSKKIKKFPSLSQWKRIFSVLSKKEKFAFFGFVALFVISGLYLASNCYLKNTIVEPAAGGIMREGAVGQPRFINPVFLSDNDIDRDLVQLMFSGLMKYNTKNELVPDLAKSYKITNGGKVYEFELKKAFWSDGQRVTADDIVFTVNLIQNTQTHSPEQIKWLGVNCQKISDSKVKFILKAPYRGFLETLTLKIIPQHIFKNILPQNLPWQLISKDYLIGSGPFKIQKIVQDKSGYIVSLTLERNNSYYGKKPLISKVAFNFYKNEDGVLKAINQGEIDGFLLPTEKTPLGENFNSYKLVLPRYFALFLNQKKSQILAKPEIREALNDAVNRKEILNKVFGGKGEVVFSPILPDFYHFQKPKISYQFNPEKAKKILDNIGFKIIDKTNIRKKIIQNNPSFTFSKDLKYRSQGKEVEKLQKCLAQDSKIYPSGKVTGYFGQKTKSAVIRFQEKYSKDILAPFGLKKGTGTVGQGTRKKLNEVCFPPSKKTIPLSLTLTTVNKQPLEEIADIVKANLEKIGFQITIEKKSIVDLENHAIKPRNYEVLLFGEVLGAIPDPFPFWHSSQKKDPGLNITEYHNPQADKLLEEARTTLDNKKAEESLEKFQNILLNDMPAVFLVKPDIIYALSKRIKGFDATEIVNPSKRFAGIENWYIKTRRVWNKK